MPGPTMMFDHCLDELKGWPRETALDFDAPLSPNVSVDPVYGGTVVHVNQSGQFELGAKGNQMPIFLLQGSDDLDVSNPGGNNWTAINPTGKMSGLVAVGAYELETTEFAVGPDYFPNDPLHAPTEDQIAGANKTMAGKLFKYASWNGNPNAPLVPTPTVTQDGTSKNITVTPSHNICAVVSRRNHINHHRVPVVSFWPVYQPGSES